jgi:DNA-binding MarR family transcriptional regulator
MIKPRRDKLTDREAIALKVIGAQGDRLIYGLTLAHKTQTSEQGAHATAASLVRKGLAERRSTGAIGYRLTDAGRERLRTLNQTPADRLAEVAMDIIDRAVSDGTLPG